MGNIKRSRQYFSTWDEAVYYYNYKKRHMSLSIDDRLVVTPAMAYEGKGVISGYHSNLYIKKV